MSSRRKTACCKASASSAWSTCPPSGHARQWLQARRLVRAASLMWIHLSAAASGGRSAWPEPLYDELAPVLKNFGRLFYMGAGPGLGQTMKLANNLLSAAAVA